MHHNDGLVRADSSDEQPHRNDVIVDRSSGVNVVVGCGLERVLCAMCRQGQQRACWSADWSVATAFRHDDVARGAATRRAKVRRREPSQSGVSVNCACATKHAVVSTRIGRDSPAAVEFFAKLGNAWLRRAPLRRRESTSFSSTSRHLVFTPMLDAHCDSALAPRDCVAVGARRARFRSLRRRHARQSALGRRRRLSGGRTHCGRLGRAAAGASPLHGVDWRRRQSVGGQRRRPVRTSRPRSLSALSIAALISWRPVPLRAIVGVGSKMRAKLAQLNCEHVRRSARSIHSSCSPRRSTTPLSPVTLFAVVRGTEPSTPLADSELEPTSVSAESFAKDIDNSRSFYVFLAALAEQLASRLIADRDTFRRVATSFALRVRYTQTLDQSFRDVKSLSRATASPSYTAASQAQLAQQLFRHAVAVLRSGGAPPVSEFVAANCRNVQLVIRGIGLAASAFVSLQRRGIDAFFGATADEGVGGEEDDDRARRN
jgi:hypothetical protein